MAPGKVVDTRPKWVDLIGYAGDTLTLRVNFSDPSYDDGCTWTGQVRRTPVPAGTPTAPDAEFTFTMTSTGAIATLAGEAMDLLVDTYGEDAAWNGVTERLYCGRYDIQISRPGFTKTLFRGSLTVGPDITESAAV